MEDFRQSGCFSRASFVFSCFNSYLQDSSGVPEGSRVPFDRDRDLTLGRLAGERTPDGLADKASVLRSKFGHGKEQKFL